MNGMKLGMGARRRIALACVLIGGLTMGSTAAEAGRHAALALHPENGHYFRFRSKPAVLVTSGEHYGAVLNRDIDIIRYLDALKADGLNLTRAFSGAYMEQPGAFNIHDNTLAPAQGRLLAPWARSDRPGYPGGGNTFDLSRWDPAYFERLRDFVTQAGRRGVVVELVLFCPYYDESQWNISPLKASNNVNGVGDLPRTEVLTLKNGGLLVVQDALVRKIAAELRGFDNLYYEICNEPYFGGVTLEWQRHIAQTIVEAEAEQPAAARHLIAQNISNGSAPVNDPDPLVSIFNFHYSSPPDSVRLNYGIGKVIGFDETGFKGVHDAPYRTEGWDFLMAGGAVYDNLDYSFSVAHPDGTAVVTDPTPGGGGPSLRRSLGALKRFMESFDLVRLHPDAGVVKGGVPEGATVRTLSEPGRQYALYVKGGSHAALRLDLPAATYRAEWVDTKTGDVAKHEELRHAGGEAVLDSPAYVEDIALRIKRR
jgi:hypothetical protein